MSDQSPTKLKLPGRGDRPPASDLLPNDAPGDKVILRPRESPGEVDATSDPSRRTVGSTDLRLREERIRRSNQRTRRQGWRQLGVALGTLAIGYGLGRRHAGPAPAVPDPPAPIVALTATEQAELDTAFAAFRSARYGEARRLFVALAQKYPRWKTLNNALAITALAAGDNLGFKKLVEEGESSGAIRPAESRLLLSQLFVGTKDYESANQFLAESASADPIRAETYYYWGDCLLRWGKPKEAAEKFRAAQLRNIYPTAETLFQTKFWLAEVESGLETTNGIGEQIDQALAAEHPTSPALFAAAARAIKAGQFAQAADHVAKARQISEPATFRIMLQDPYFYGEHWRPEFRAIFAEAFKSTQ